MKDPEHLKEAIEALGGEFELIRELGQGATAVVYLLRDHALDRDVAMKVIRATFAGDDEAIARLQREARLVAQLTHPNIVKLYGTHRLSDGSFTLFMEHVPGRNLKELLREEGAYPVPKALRVLKDVASALAYAHRRRIVHRDVKPENIYIDEEVGAARLADFGVARPWDQDARLTLPGASLGTPAYMSPEQIDGQEVDGRSDVYSLGLVGYELLLGHHPWEGENVFTIIYRQKNDELPIEDLGLGDYPALEETLKQALEKNPANRLESAVAFLERLSDLDGSQVLATPRKAGTQESVRLKESLTPVDWGTVDVAELAPSTGPVSGDDSDEGPVLGVQPRKQWRRWGLALVGALAIASIGMFTWQPWDRPTLDPGAFIPVTPPPSTTAEPTAQPNDDVAIGPTGLHPTQDSLFHGVVGSLLPLSVRATDPDGNPLVDALVVFRVTDGFGILETEEVPTDSDGLAEANLRLPNRPGEMLVLAQIPGPDTLRTLLPVTAETGPAQRMVSIAGDGQRAGTGQALTEALGVRVVDEFGNSIPGAEVRFRVLQGGGRIAPPASPTDEEGRAFARWTLGGAAGTQLVAAVVAGAEEALLTFQATAVAPSRPEPEPEPEPPPVQADRPGEPRTGPVTVIAKTFAVGGSQVCHLVGGTAVCRGANDRGQGGDRSLTGLVGLAAGISHACGLDARGGPWCWGANESGQLGDGSTTDRQPAGPVETAAHFSILAGGLHHTCGLGEGGQASCWGRNINGQLGTGSREDQRRPVAVSGDHAFQDLIAGWNHTCGLAFGATYCWGSNSAGQVGDGSQVDRLAPTRVAGSFQNLSAGARHTCGISGSEVLCWGDNDFGQLGDGTTEDRSSPVSVSNLPGTPVALAAGAVHTCAVLNDRSAYCWGQNLHGQLGDGTTTNRSSPVAVSSGVGFVALFAGGGVTCGFARDGSEHCWGLNQFGQLGDGTRTNRSSPVRVGGNLP
jgi:serine/threonine protein kinase